MPGKKQQHKKTKSRTTKVVTIRRPRVRGRGNYLMDAVNGIKGAFADPVGAAASVISTLNEDQRSDASSVNKFVNGIGRTIGDKFGVGKQVGNAASWLSRVFGFGKYTVKSNSLVSGWGQNVHSGMNYGAPPTFANPRTGSDIIIAHSEFISEIQSSTSFATTTYAINPGNPTLFPWFSQIAKLYEEYEILGLLYEYRPTIGSGTNAAVPLIGSVAMATDYDVYDSNYSTMTSLLNAEFASSAVADQSFMHAVECDPRRNVLKSLYVQPGLTQAVVPQGDARFSFMANTTVATEGQAASGVIIGKLYVTYHIRLSRPMLEQQNNDFTQCLQGTLSGDSTVVFTKNQSWGGVAFNPTITGTGTNTKLVLTNIGKLTGTFLCSLTINANGVYDGELFNVSQTYASYDPPFTDEINTYGSSHTRIAYNIGVSRTPDREYSDYHQYGSTYFFKAVGSGAGYIQMGMPHLAGEGCYFNLILTSINPDAMLPAVTGTDDRLAKLELLTQQLLKAPTINLQQGTSSTSSNNNKTSKDEIQDLTTQIELLSNKIKSLEDNSDPDLVHINQAHFKAISSSSSATNKQ